MQCLECSNPISSKAIFCPRCGCPVQPEALVVQGRGEDINYYRMVRTSIQRLDQLRLETVAVGLTLVAGLLGASAAAAFSWAPQYLPVFGLRIAVSHLAATVAAGLAAVLVRPFLQKIDMFNRFLSAAVEIAGDIELRIIKKCDFPTLALTRRFETAHPRAGRGGDVIFSRTLRAMQAAAGLGAAYFGWQTLVRSDTVTPDAVLAVPNVPVIDPKISDK